jgi:hypothetical protein
MIVEDGTRSAWRGVSGTNQARKNEKTDGMQDHGSAGEACPRRGHGKLAILEELSSWRANAGGFMYFDYKYWS